MTARLNARRGRESCFGYPGIGRTHLKASQHLSQTFEDGMGGTNMATKPKTLNREQIAVIHVAAHQLGMCDEDYRALLMGTAGVRSASDLDQVGFERVMKRFDALGFARALPKSKAKPKARNYGERLGMASDAQVRTIRVLWRDWHGDDGPQGDRALRHWLERFHHVSDLRFCSGTTAQKAIEGLKAMNGRKRSANAKEMSHE